MYFKYERLDAMLVSSGNRRNRKAEIQQKVPDSKTIGGVIMKAIKKIVEILEEYKHLCEHNVTQEKLV